MDTIHEVIILGDTIIITILILIMATVMDTIHTTMATMVVITTLIIHITMDIIITAGDIETKPITQDQEIPEQILL